MKHQSKQKQVKKEQGKTVAKPGQKDAAKAKQCSIQCPVCKTMLSDKTVAKAHFEAKHSKLPMPAGWPPE